MNIDGKIYNGCCTNGALQPKVEVPCARARKLKWGKTCFYLLTVFIMRVPK